jgi:hypothetical protein
MYFSPKTSADGLVFHYDTGNTVRSYLGEPTTNLAYAVNSYLNSNGNWWINAGNTIFNDNDTSIQKPVIPNVDTSNLRIFSSTVTGTGGNQQLGSSIITVSSSTTYSFSIYYYFTGTTMQVQPYVRTAVNNDLLAYFGYNGDTNYLNWPRNKWILLKATVTTQANENGIYMSSYTGDTLGEKLAYFGYQVEQKSHCTPLVLGTRSATQGLKDLTGKSTIDLTNVSFDSNAQMTFDGTNDAISVTTPSGFSGSGTWTLNTWFKINGAPSSNVYMNVILDMNPTGGSANMICVNWSDMRLQYRSRPVGGSYTDINGSILTQGVWYNATVVKNGASDTKLYLNGVQDGGTYSGDLPAGNQSTFNIGRWTDGTVFANATIPVIHIYNRALTADEVARNYNAIKSRFNIG